MADVSRWERSWPKAARALNECNMLFAHALEHAEELRGMPLKAQRWLTDTGAWSHTVIASVVRETLIHPQQGPARNRGGPAQWKWEELEVCDGSPLPAAIAEDLSRAQRSGDLAASVAHKCFRWLKRQDPQPTARMQINGQLGTVAQTRRVARARQETGRR